AQALADCQNLDVLKNGLADLPQLALPRQDDIDVVVGHDEAARGRVGADGDRDAALALLQDGGEIALVGAHQLLLEHRVAGEDFAARPGAGDLLERARAGGNGDVFGAHRPFGPVLPLHGAGREPLADPDRLYGDQDLGLLFLDDLGDRDDLGRLVAALGGEVG